MSVDEKRTAFMRFLNDDQMWVPLLLLFCQTLLKLKKSHPVLNFCAPPDLLNCKQVYEYEVQLLSCVHTSYLMFWTLDRDIKPLDCGITTLSNSWKRLWLPPRSPSPIPLSSPKLAWNSNPFPRIPPPQAGNGETKPGVGQRGTPSPSSHNARTHTSTPTHTHTQPANQTDAVGGARSECVVP